MTAVFRQALKPIDGVAEMLDAIRLPICVASGAPQEKIELTLAITGLLPRFQGRIFSSYELNLWKPNPGLFLHAAGRLGITPDQCAVVEDSPPGVYAGLAAGMKVFHYVANGEFTCCGADPVIRFRHMSQLPRLLGV